MSKVFVSKLLLGGLALAGVVLVAMLAGMFDADEQRRPAETVAEAPVASPSVQSADVSPNEPKDETAIAPPAEPMPTVEPEPPKAVENAALPDAEEEPPAEEMVADRGDRTVSAGAADDAVVVDTDSMQQQTEAAAASPDLPEPEFDLVRVDADGFGLAAGRALPGEQVVIRIGGELVATGKAGRDGAFAITFQTPGADDAGNDALTVVAEAGETEDEGRSSEPVFIVATAGQNEEAPLIVQPKAEGVVLLQPPGLAEAIEVSLDAISYDDEGRVVFVGRATARTVVRLYLDNNLTLTTTAADDGSWRGRADLPIAPGVYTLRVDQIDRDGKVLARVETPFQREKIEQGDIGENRITVQKGNNLWKLAERLYGSGARYTVIFKANQDTIRDPDLIYPGQIFTIPDEKRAEIVQ